MDGDFATLFLRHMGRSDGRGSGVAGRVASGTSRPDEDWARIRHIEALIASGRGFRRVYADGAKASKPPRESLGGAGLSGKKAYSVQSRRRHVAERKAECAICWEPLVAKPLGSLIAPGGARRSCPHLLHAECAQQWFRPGVSGCPLCRASVGSVSVLPDFTKSPTDFFAALDVNGNGALDKQEALFALRSTLPVDRDGVWLDAHFDSLWQRWDEDGNGEVSLPEFVAPRRGMLAYIQEHCPSRAMTRPDDQIPSISDVGAWFQYWDEDGSGTLDRNEVVRAVIRSFQLEWSLEEVWAVRRLLETRWAENTGGDFAEVRLTRDDLATGGSHSMVRLAETISEKRRKLRHVDALGEARRIGARPGGTLTEESRKLKKRSSSRRRAA